MSELAETDVMSLPKQSLRQLKTIARIAGLEAKEDEIAGMKANIELRYGKALVLQKLLGDSEIAAVQCGAKGRWLAVLPLEKLLRFISDARLVNCER